MSGLLVVWELATDDYGFFSLFRPAIRIAEACENRGIPLRFLFARDVPSFLAGNPVAGIGNAARQKPYRCLIRGMTDPTIIEHIENAGIPCVNGSKATRLANDKLATARLAQASGIPTPRVVEAPVPRDIPFPLVVKPRFGARGRGVALARDENEAALLAGLAAPAIYQEYVASSRGKDLRVFFAEGRIVAVAVRESADGGLVSNAAEGGRMRKAELPAAGGWEGRILSLAEAAGLRYGTADFLFGDDGGLTLCELNAAPGFEELERTCALDVAGTIVDAATAPF